MARFESGTIITLEPREVITLPDVRGAMLRVTNGTLWLTEERDRNDIVLGPGDSWVVESDGNTVVEAQNSAVFRIVGRQGTALQLPAFPRVSESILSTLSAWLSAPPRHHAPYA